MKVIDSCIFASVIVGDEFYEVCRGYLLGKKATLDLAYAETGNVLWKHVKMGRIPTKEVAKRTELLKKLIDTAEVYRSEDFLSVAIKIAVDTDITVYDALFLALAAELETTLVTLDRELHRKLRNTELSNLVETIV